MHTEHLFRVHLYYWWALDFNINTGILPCRILLDVLAVVGAYLFSWTASAYRKSVLAYKDALAI